MSNDPQSGLSAREREIMNILHEQEEATAQTVRSAMSSPPTDATVRSTLRVLEDKGWISHRRDAGRFYYRPVQSRERVRQGMLRHVVRTFFDDSPAEMVAALLDRRRSRLRDSDRDRIREILAELQKSEKKR